VVEKREKVENPGKMDETPGKRVPQVGVPEDAVVGTLLARISVTDPDSKRFSVKLAGGPGADRFAVRQVFSFFF
jgi:hypothetical protein